MGKGSKPRPIFIDMGKFDENWDKIFGNKDNEPSEKDEQFYKEILKEQENDEPTTRDNNKH